MPMAIRTGASGILWHLSMVECFGSPTSFNSVSMRRMSSTCVHGTCDFMCVEIISIAYVSAHSYNIY